MQRRRLLQWSLASLAVLATAGGVLVVRSPGLVGTRLGPAARVVMTALAQGLLDGTLPTESVARRSALDGLLQRLDDLVAGLPAHAQTELSQLLAILASAPGRRWLAGLDTPWNEANVPQVQAALADMRGSPLSPRLQAYQALHDLVGGAYFADPSAWTALGYPGPRALTAADAAKA